MTGGRLSRRSLLAGGVASIALLLPGAALAKGVLPPNFVDGPGYIPKAAAIEYGAKANLTQAELAALRGITRWETTLPAASRGASIVSRVAAKSGAKFVAGRLAAAMTFGSIPVGGWVISAGLLLWTAYDIYQAVDDLGGANSKVRPQGAPPPISASKFGTPPTTGQAANGAVVRTAAGWENPLTYERNYNLTYWADICRSSPMGSITDPAGWPGHMFCWAWVPINNRNYSQTNIPSDGPVYTAFATNNTYPFIAGVPSGATRIFPTQSASSRDQGYDTGDTQKRAYPYSVGRPAGVEEDRMAGFQLYTTLMKDAREYLPIFPPNNDYPNTDLLTAVSAMPPETLINPALQAEIMNKALRELYQADPANVPDPSKYPFVPGNFDLPLTAQDLKETLPEGRKQALSPNDPYVSQAVGSMTAPSTSANPEGNPNAPAPAFPGTSPSTGGTGTTNPNTPTEEAQAEVPIDATDWTLLPKANSMSWTASPAACPPITIIRATDMHCRIVNPQVPVIRGIETVVAPIVTGLIALGLK